MKTLHYKIAFTLSLLLLLYTSSSANNYQEAMQQNIKKMYLSHSADELYAVSGSFFRISVAEKDQWLPLYYAAYSLVRIPFFMHDAEKIDGYLDQAQAYLETLKEHVPNESEVYVLQSLLYSMRITSADRGMKFSMLSNSALEKAEELNPQNPRIYYCKGNNVLHTPKFYGGGKEKALPLFLKAKTLFSSFQSPETFWPEWGLQHNNQMIVECNKKDN